jgi:hypothetical protein
MISDQATRAFPGALTTACTLTFYFRKRTVEGSGSYNVIAGFPDLAISFPNGRADSLPHEVIREIVIAHLLNNNVQDHWAPRSGTPEQGLRTALASGDLLPSSPPNNPFCALLFDGQFGSVRYG